MAHTPGPWKVIEGRSNFEQEPAFGSIVSYIEPDEDEWYIAKIEPNSPNREADAHLIAAAPELLEALEAFVGCLTHTKPRTWDTLALSGVLNGAYAAIAKARGE